jgi:hypothetical protein
VPHENQPLSNVLRWKLKRKTLGSGCRSSQDRSEEHVEQAWSPFVDLARSLEDVAIATRRVAKLDPEDAREQTNEKLKSEGIG